MNTQGIVAVVSHDAGGAEILASYVSQHTSVWRFVLEGSAVSVFNRRLGAVELTGLADALSVCDELLCGTSWQSDLEWRAIGLGQAAGKRTIAFLDHWINYPQRFVRNGVQHLPDELWVGDAYAERLAREHFPDLPIRLEPNPYFIDIRRQLAELEVSSASAVGKGKRVLYVSENISQHARTVYGDERYFGYTEFDAIEYFLDNIHVLGYAIDGVLIRPHPSDANGKYDGVIGRFSGIAQLSNGKPLLNEIAEADVVVGSQSMAMVVGLLANKMVISCIPPGGPSCNLPQPQILIFSELVATAS